MTDKLDIVKDRTHEAVDRINQQYQEFKEEADAKITQVRDEVRNTVGALDDFMDGVNWHSLEVECMGQHSPDYAWYLRCLRSVRFSDELIKADSYLM